MVSARASFRRETERLVIRIMTMADVDAHAQFLSDSGVMFAPGKTVEEVNAHLRRLLRKTDKNGGYVFLGFPKDIPDRLALNIVVAHDFKRRARVYAGYNTLKGFQRCGLMTEALGTMIEPAKHIMSVRAIFAEVDKDNEASIKVLRRTGFKQENILPDGKGLIQFRHGRV